MAGALPAGADGESASARAKLDSAIGLLGQVIDLLDSADARPDLAARAQEALDVLLEYRSSKES
jgi:hypothetical protein